MSDEISRKKVSVVGIYTAYYATLLLFLVASFFPQYRVWGFNWWAYYPVYVPFGLFAIGAIAPFVVHLLLKRFDTKGETNHEEGDNTTYYIVITCLTVLFGLGFYFLRARTYFLGDGYTLISLLADSKPLVKSREIGEAMAHIWLKHAIGGDGTTGALLSYQIISIGSGIFLLVVLGWFAKKLFSRMTERILFWLGIASSGFILLYFGYVENYSLFVLSVLVFTLLGILIARGDINRWLIVPAVALAIFFHIMGVTLIPSAVYLLVAGTRPGNVLARLSHKTKLFLAGMCGIGLGYLLYHYYSTDLFFRFALVPFMENEFTVEGYTVFSLQHLADFINLLILLFPGILLFVVMIYFLPLRTILQRRDYRFLLVLFLSTLGAVFIFDPKLGMPRDWDLFAFAGVPVAVFAYMLLLEYRDNIKLKYFLCSISIVINFLLLTPRIVSQTIPQNSISHFKYYLHLDQKKNRNSVAALINYYNDNGMELLAIKEKEEWKKRLPDVDLVEKATNLIDNKQFQQAKEILQHAIHENPYYWAIWGNMGHCYIELGEYDSALIYLKIAAGMNPYNAFIHNNLAYAYYYLHDYDNAEKMWKLAQKEDSTMIGPLTGLALLYQDIGYEEKYAEYFFKVVAHKDAPYDFLNTLGEYYLQNNKFPEAATAFKRAQSQNPDSSFIDSLLTCHPELGKYFYK